MAALLADTHGLLPLIDPRADVILHAGDLGPDREPEAWLAQVFPRWQRTHGKPFFGTWGNHDRIGERLHSLHDAQAVIVADQALTVGGKRLWFSPWSIAVGRWAFVAREARLAQIYAAIPDDTQILVTHGPPHLCRDLAQGKHRVGSPSLLTRIGQLRQLELVVTGHIHEDAGEGWILQHDPDRRVRVMNVACVDEWYTLRPAPVTYVTLDAEGHD